MAKKIKAIKCPQCGSTKATETRTDFYRCNSCKTEFFLDNDDIYIYHTHKNDAIDFIKNKAIYFLIGTFGLIFFIFIFSSVFSNHSTPLPPPSPVVEEEKKEEIVQWDVDKSFGFVNGEKEPMILLIGQRYKDSERFDDNREHITYIGIYEAKTTKEILIKPISGLELKSTKIESLNIRTFQDATTYLVFNNYRLYKFNSISYELTEVIPQSLGIPEFESGLSRIELLDTYGDGFKVITNTGKYFFFYPIINKVYKEDEFYSSLDKKLPDAIERTGFDFSFKGYTDEPIQLVKYTYAWKLGYPRVSPRFFLQKDYGDDAPFFVTERTPFTKVFINYVNNKRAKILSYKDFTPGRTYFSPTVLYGDDKQVLIRFKPTLSPEATVSIQLLDAQTGEIKWTIPVTEKNFETSKTALATKDDGFILLDYSKYWVIDKDGKTVKTIDVRDDF